MECPDQQKKVNDAHLIFTMPNRQRNVPSPSPAVRALAHGPDAIQTECQFARTGAFSEARRGKKRCHAKRHGCEQNPCATTCTDQRLFVSSSRDKRQFFMQMPSGGEVKNPCTSHMARDQNGDTSPRM